jgi:hypothetical protein
MEVVSSSRSFAMELDVLLLLAMPIPEIAQTHQLFATIITHVPPILVQSLPVANLQASVVMITVLALPILAIMSLVANIQTSVVMIRIYVQQIHAV